MSNTFLRRRRPVFFYVRVIVLGLVTFVAVGLVVQTALTPSDPPDHRVPAAGAGPGSVAGIDQSGKLVDFGEHASPLRLLTGKRMVHDVSVGYPHTMLGAISAAVQYWGQMAATLDTARAARIATVIADPEWKTAVAELSQGPINTRKRLGLPTSGPAPDGASVLLTPVAYQIQQIRTDSVTVLLLGYLQTTTPGQEPQNRIGVFPLQMKWTVGDWKVPAPTLAADYSGLQATPGSEQAAAMGWLPLASQ
ncbi:hypothetical protein ABZU32_06110 [Sphaerisporangium sp. NPDC005288]|uniref:hypothetical protein n=1 Tax=Sphaerisporangium sp. NPDC005288 TaxID=3155114 RepID=UPI0033BF431C